MNWSHLFPSEPETSPRLPSQLSLFPCWGQGLQGLACHSSLSSQHLQLHSQPSFPTSLALASTA